MRPSDYDADAIINAGKELLASGRRVTGFALRKQVGGGAAPRLKQVWDAYQKSQSTAEAEEQVDLPVEVADQLQTVTAGLVEKLRTLAQDLNKHAVNAAERRVADIVRATGQQRSEMETELADASSTVDDLEVQLAKSREESARLATRNEELVNQVQQQAVELAQLRERLQAAELGMRTAQEQFAAEHQQANTARDNASRLQGQVEALERQLAARR